MSNFIKSFIPNIFGYIGFFFKAISTFFLYISFSLHKLLKTKLGIRIMKLEKTVKKMENAIKNINKPANKTSNTQNKSKSIIPMDPNSKLAQIIGKDDEQN